MNTIVISPHFDDAVLSTAGAIQLLGSSTRFVTVHGGRPGAAPLCSDWDRLSGFSSGTDAACGRAEEDLAACETLGVEAQHLDLPDSPYLNADAELEEVVGVLSADLGQSVRVLAPAGVGSNADHVRVRDAILAVMEGIQRVDVWLYADLPYASRSPDWLSPSFGVSPSAPDILDAFNPLLARYQLHQPIRLDLSAEAWRLKQAAVLCHASQLLPLSERFPGFLSDPGPLQHEMFWRVSMDGGIADRAAWPRFLAGGASSPDGVG